MRVAWQHEAAQLRDAAVFTGLPDPALWSGPPVRESEIAAWMEEVKFFTTIEIDSVLTVHSRSGNAFELYGKGRSFLNPVRLARYAPYAVEAESAPENPEILARARTAWREYVDGVARRIGAPVRVTEDDAEVPEAVWRPGGEEGPHLRLWMNSSHGLDPDSPLFTRIPGRVLVRLDAHAPADLAYVTPRGSPGRATCRSGSRTGTRSTPSSRRDANTRRRTTTTACSKGSGTCWAARSAPEDPSTTTSAALATTPAEAHPDTDSYLWQHTFRHPDAPQGRLRPRSTAHVISVLANHEKEGSARTPESVEPGLTLHYYDLFDPRMQNALAVTGREACALWRTVRSSYERSITGKSYLITPRTSWTG